MKFQKTALFIAVENQNLDIIKLLLDHPNIDVNIKSVFNYINNTISNLKLLLHFCLVI